MNTPKIIFSFFIMLWIVGCSPKIRTKISKQYAPLHYEKPVTVIALDAKMPENAEVLGDIRIGDNGLSVNCTYEKVIRHAKDEARKAGGNAIKITEHKLPSVLGSSCHRIKAKILLVSDIEIVEIIENEDDIIPGVKDYAIINIYRYPGVGSLIGYDLFLGNKKLCRVQNNFKKSIQVSTFGMNTIWAKTESKKELPVKIEPGHQYYIRCGINMGVMVGRPDIEFVSPGIGKVEYQSFNAKHQ